MTDTCYVVVRDRETHKCLEECYEFDNRDEANGFILGLRKATTYYDDKIVRVEATEPDEEEIDRT
jgi:hypothetical protein